MGLVKYCNPQSGGSHDHGGQYRCLAPGEIEQTEAPLDRNPGNRFVSGFIGSRSMNFLQGNEQGDSIAAPTLKSNVELNIEVPVNGTDAVLGVQVHRTRRRS